MIEDHIWKSDILTVLGQCKDLSLSNLIGIFMVQSSEERLGGFEKFHVCTRVFMFWLALYVDWMSIPLDVRLWITKANVVIMDLFVFEE